MKKISAILVFVFSIQVSMPSFAQDSSSSSTRQFIHCINDKYEEFVELAEKQIDFHSIKKAKVTMKLANLLRDEKNLHMQYLKAHLVQAVTTYRDQTQTADISNQAKTTMIGGAIIFGISLIVHHIKNNRVIHMKQANPGMWIGLVIFTAGFLWTMHSSSENETAETKSRINTLNNLLNSNDENKIVYSLYNTTTPEMHGIGKYLITSCSQFNNQKFLKKVMSQETNSLLEQIDP